MIPRSVSALAAEQEVISASQPACRPACLPGCLLPACLPACLITACACPWRRWQGEDNPLAFKPERWLHGAASKAGAWIPFGGGVRLCLGWLLAMVEMKVGGEGVGTGVESGWAGQRELEPRLVGLLQLQRVAAIHGGKQHLRQQHRRARETGCW